MDAQGLGRGGLEEVEVLVGGTQNVLVRFARHGRSYVLRRPPLHKRDDSDRTMRREAQVLAALAGTDVPHPGLIAACGDADVLGAAFYLMEPVAGVNITVEVPPLYSRDPKAATALGLDMVDSLAALGRVDASAEALAGLGRPEGWLERQVERWRSHLASYAAVAAWPGLEGVGVETVARWLEERRPVAWTPGVIHGDYHLANVMVATDRPALTAIVDWELATIGDPLLDLGHLLATWPDPRRPVTVGPVTELPGLPGPAVLVERYSQGSDRDLSAVGWYRVLACYRLGIILEGTHVRACAGQATREVGDRLHHHTLALFDQARELIGA